MLFLQPRGKVADEVNAKSEYAKGPAGRHEAPRLQCESEIVAVAAADSAQVDPIDSKKRSSFNVGSELIT